VIEMTGIGLASAVLVDATLVRLFMAPAALTLLGGRLWPSRPRAASRTVVPVREGAS
jgi:putative drug exporter of the RND superfamily